MFLFRSVDTWQLVINTATSVLAFLLVALLQNSERRYDRALHEKVDALASMRSCDATRPTSAKPSSWRNRSSYFAAASRPGPGWGRMSRGSIGSPQWSQTSRGCACWPHSSWISSTGGPASPAV
jgi:low affinity iron permease